MKAATTIMMLGILATSLAPCFAQAQVFSDDFEGDLSAWFLNKDAVIVQDPLDPENNVVTFVSPNNTFDLLSEPLVLDPGITYRMSICHLGLETPESLPGNFGGYIGLRAGLTGYFWETTPCDPNTQGDLIDDGQWHCYEWLFIRADLTSDPTAPIEIMVEDWDGAASVCPPNATSGDVFFDNILVEEYEVIPVGAGSWGTLKSAY